ncbi:MAG: hypothetical protein WAL75_24960 [Terracidiphilus sp.]
MSIKAKAIVGATVGAGVASVLLALDNIRPLAPDANAFVERLTFKLCPLYVLGFGNWLPNYASLAVVTILGDAILGCALFGGAAIILSLFEHVFSKA